MATRAKKSEAVAFLEKLIGGPLSLRKLIEAIRLGEEMSQPAFAAQLGISRSSLNDIEKGRKLVSPERAYRYAKLLGHSEHLWMRLAIEDQLARDGLYYEVTLEAKPVKRRAA